VLIHLFSPLAQLALHLTETDFISVRDIVYEIEQRIDRFRNGFGNKAKQKT